MKAVRAQWVQQQRGVSSKQQKQSTEAKRTFDFRGRKTADEIYIVGT